MYLKCYVVIHGGGLVVPISDVRTLNRTIQWRLPFHGPNLGHLCWTYCTVTNFQASTISEAGPLKPFARGGILKSNPRRSHHRFNHDIFLDVYTAGSNDDTRPSRTHILKPESVGTWFLEPLRIATNRHQSPPICTYHTTSIWAIKSDGWKRHQFVLQWYWGMLTNRFWQSRGCQESSRFSSGPVDL